jgi:hypothetical protein
MEVHISATEKKDYRQDQKAVKEWLEVTYPEIVKKAEDEKAEIWWLDETGIRNLWQLRQRVSAMRQNANASSCVSSHWGKHDFGDNQRRKTAVSFLSRKVQSECIHRFSDASNQGL